MKHPRREPHRLLRGGHSVPLLALIVGNIAPAHGAQPPPAASPLAASPPTQASPPSVAPEQPATPQPGAQAPAESGPEAPPTTPAPPEPPGASEPFQPPQLLEDAPPVYPAEAKAQGIGATVALDLDLDTAGRVENATVSEPSATPEWGFEAAALEAAKRLIFSPALEGKVPVPVRITYRFHFVPGPVPPGPSAPEATQPQADPGAGATPVRAAPLARGQLSGTLLERGTRAPISGVKVTVFRGEGANAEGYETESDADGHFLLADLAAGDWQVLADPKGYFPVRTTEQVLPNSRTDVKYLVEKGSYNPYDVEVETERVKREVNHIAMDARQAERLPGSFGDPLAGIQNFPGVARTSFFNFTGGFPIRGSAPKDSRILLNGMEVPLLYHFGGLRSVIPSGMLETINFYPGNFSVEYGRATGGIVDIEMRKLKRKRFGGYLDVNLMDSSLYVEVPIGDKLSVAVAGRRSYIDALLGPLLSTGGNTVIAPRYYDAQALVSYRPSPAHQVRGFFLFSDDRFEILFKNPEATQASTVVSGVGLSTQFYRGQADYQFVPDTHFENKFKISFGNDRNSFNVGEIASATNLYQLQARDTARYAWSDAVALRGGVDYLFQHREVETTLPSTSSGSGSGGSVTLSSSESTKDYHSIAGFMEAELKPWTGMLAVPGVRFDYFGRTATPAVSPRLVLRQALNKEWLLKGGVGLFQQEPTFDETDPTTGNPDLQTQKAMHYSAGFEFTPRPYLNLGITGYYKNLYDVVEASNATTTVDGKATPLNYDNGALGRAMGVEISARHDFNENLYAWVIYTLSRSERLESGDADYHLFEYDQTHNLTIIGSYKLPRNWEIGIRFRYVTGNVYTPVIGSLYSADSNDYLAVYGAENSGRLSDFHQLDFRIDKRWIYDTWMLNAYLDIQNVYSQANVEDLSYNYDYSKTTPTTGLPIVPVVGLRGEF